jgi:hypothetical protein
MADSGRALPDHKAAVRHSGRVVRTLHSVRGAIFRTDFIHRIRTLLAPITYDRGE